MITAEISFQEVELRDSYWTLNGMETELERTFRVDTQTIKAKDYVDRKHMTIRFDVMFDILFFQRQVYSFTDVLKDVGGLSTSMMSFFTISVMILTYQKDRLDIARQIYSKRELRDRCVRMGEIKEHDEEMKDLERPLRLNTWKVIKINLLSKLKCRRGCCLIKKSYHDRLFLKALDKFKKQINVIEFFQEFRELKSAMQMQLTHG